MQAYPLLPWLLKVYPAPRGQIEEDFNAALTRTRQTVERAIGRLKRAFFCLRDRLRFPCARKDARVIMVLLPSPPLP